ncbi:MAG: Fic family protein [archaeon]
MVYIYKKKIGNKDYYYLRASERKNGKVIVKDIAYLGNNIENVKNSIEKLPKYKAQIRKAYRTINNFLESNRFIQKAKKIKFKKDSFLNEKIIEIEACKLHYIKDFKKQDSITKHEILKNFIIEFAHNTTSIEGNTINLEEARNLLESGKTPKNKTLREIYDLQNTENVFNELLKSNEDISHEIIINVHKKLLNNIDERIGYRTRDVRVFRSNFDATPASYVKTDMDLLLKWFKENKSKLHPFVLTILFHHKFEKIHPFMDGNGRTGRMLMNFILMKNNYPPLIIRNKDRDTYLNCMRKADSSDLFKSEVKSYFDLVQFVVNEMIVNYWNLFL